MSEVDEDRCIGIIGLGLVGKALAQRLMSGGYSVWGYDVDEGARNAAAALGVHVVDTLDAAASFPRTWESRTRQEHIEASLDPRVRGDDGIGLRGAGEVFSQHCGCILLSLPTSEIRRELLFGDAAFASMLAEGTLLLDTTTGRAKDLEADAKRLAEAQIDLVDVCVLASSTQVARGEAVLLVGDSAAGASGYDSLLDCFSRKIFYLGSAGDGCRMKLVANQVIGLHRLVLAEALGMAEKAGLDLGKTLEVLQSGPAASQVMVTKGRKMIDRDFEAQARLAQHAKDVGLILEMAESVGADMPLSRLHFGVLQDLIDGGYGEEDNAAVIRAFR